MKNLSQFVTLGLISLIVTFILMVTFTPVNAQASIYDEPDVGLESFESNEIIDESSELNEIELDDFQNPYTVSFDELDFPQTDDTDLEQNQSDGKTLDSDSTSNSQRTEIDTPADKK